jgi:hypothetical protein
VKGCSELLLPIVPKESPVKKSVFGILAGVLTLSAQAGAANFSFLQKDVPIAINAEQSLYYYEGIDEKDNSLCFLALQVRDDGGKLKITGIANKFDDVTAGSENYPWWTELPNETYSISFKDVDANHLNMTVDRHRRGFLDNITYGSSAKYKMDHTLFVDDSGRLTSVELRVTHPVLSKVLFINTSNFHSNCTDLQNVSEIAALQNRKDSGMARSIEKFMTSDMEELKARPK